MVNVEAISGFVLNVLMILAGVVLIGGVLIFATWLFIRWKKYHQYKVVVWGKDAFGQTIETEDSGGVFVDPKTNNKRFFLRKGKVGLNADRIPYIHTGGKPKIYLRRFGLKNYSFIRPVLGDVTRFEVGEEDVNWALNSYERGKKIFSQDRLLQYMPFILLAFVAIIILVIFIYLFKQFPDLVSMSENFRAGSEALAQGMSGTQILS